MSEYRIPGTAQKDTCRGCGATIFFVPTPAGRWMPTNPDGTSHFSTCKQAEMFRNRPAPPVDQEHLEEFDERVGILIYDAGMSPPEAEAKVAAELRRKYPVYEQQELAL